MKWNEVLIELLAGKVARRKEWEWGTYIYVSGNYEIPVDKLTHPILKETVKKVNKDIGTINIYPHIDLFIQGDIEVGYNLPTKDILADDWEFVEEE